MVKKTVLEAPTIGPKSAALLTPRSLLKVVAPEGTLCAGRYRLDRVLLHGPCGVVYGAHDLQSGTACALQLLYPHHRDPQALSALQRDALLAAAAEHRAILAPQATGFDEDGSFFLVSDVVECESLRAHLARGALSPKETLAVLGPVCAALQAAAAKGLHHGRLGPLSVLLLSGGRVFLTDFGTHHLGQSPWVETAAYLPPEAYAGEHRASEAGDVFALGALLFECLAGRRMFDGTSAANVMIQICVAPLPAFPPGVLTDGQQGVDALLRRACAKSPEARPTLESLAAELRAILSHLKPQAGAQKPPRSNAGLFASAAPDHRDVGQWKAMDPAALPKVERAPVPAAPAPRTPVSEPLPSVPFHRPPWRAALGALGALACALLLWRALFADEHRALFDAFLLHAARGDVDTAVELYLQLPTGSRYHQQGQPAFASLRTQYEQTHLQIAKLALDGAQCELLHKETKRLQFVARGAASEPARQAAAWAATCRGPESRAAGPR